MQRRRVPDIASRFRDDEQKDQRFLRKVCTTAVIPAKAGILCLNPLKPKALDYSPHPRLALRAIGCADVRYGIPAFAVPLSRE